MAELAPAPEPQENTQAPPAGGAPAPNIQSQQINGEIIDGQTNTASQSTNNLFTQKNITIGAVVIILTVALGYFVMRPQYKVLYSGLETSDAAAISSYLKKQNIKFKIEGDGNTIMVSGGSIPRLRLDLASKGVPKGGGIGFEAFDKKDLTSTNFGEKVKYQRALEGELARTISSLDSVKAARVHIVLPKKSVFQGSGTTATASVVITPEFNATLSFKQTKGIQHLVASAIPNLDAKNVQITDSNGVSLISTDESGYNSERDLENDRKQRKLEEKMEQDLSRLLTPILGPGNVLVNIKVDMNFDQKQKNIELFSPLGEDGKPIAPVIRSEQVSKEKYSKDGATTSVGMPGTRNNVPSFTGTTITTNADGDDKGYTKEDTTKNYEISKTIETVKLASGIVEKISVAVVVNKDLSPAEKATLRETVTVATGLNTDRGDQVVITGIKFSSSRFKDIDEIKQQKQLEDVKHRNLIKKYVSLVVTLLIGGVITILVLNLIKKSLLTNSNDELDKLLDETEVAILNDIDTKIEEAELAYSKKITMEGNKTIQQMKDELQKTIQQNPKAVARSLESFISDGSFL